MFIELHNKKCPALFNIKNIELIVDAAPNGCHVYIGSPLKCFQVDETYEQIIELIRKAVSYDY